MSLKALCLWDGSKHVVPGIFKGCSGRHWWDNVFCFGRNFSWLKFPPTWPLSYNFKQKKPHLQKVQEKLKIEQEQISGAECGKLWMPKSNVKVKFSEGRLNRKDGFSGSSWRSTLMACTGWTEHRPTCLNPSTLSESLRLAALCKGGMPCPEDKSHFHGGLRGAPFWVVLQNLLLQLHPSL